MRAVVVYESMFGNTREVAEMVGAGIDEWWSEVMVVPVGEADDDALAACGLLVVGGPTHAWSTSRPGTRRAAAARGRDDDHVLEAGAERSGLREWFASRREVPATLGAAFDTRRAGPYLVTGGASPRIARALGRWGCVSVVDPASFTVDRDDRLLPGELARARAWGSHVARAAGEYAAV